MNSATLAPRNNPLLKDWTNPAAGITLGDNVLNVVQSLGKVFWAVTTSIIGADTPGDGAVVRPAETLLRNPNGVQELLKYTRLAANQLSLIYAEYKHLVLPYGTKNFILLGPPIPNAPQQNELNLSLPAGCDIEDREAIQRKLDEFSEILRRAGYVASMDGRIILNPGTHFAVALVYDELLKRICIHFRDTASDGFWESGSGVNWAADISQGLGLMPDVYADGDMFVRGCVEIFGPEMLQIVGYSMGGGIGIFAGIRNFVKVLALNSAFLSPLHERFFPENWQQFAADNVRVISVANDILSSIMDNPMTGGILPTALQRGVLCYTTDPAPNPFRGHYLSELVKGLMHLLIRQPELRGFVIQILLGLPDEALTAFIRQDELLAAHLLLLPFATLAARIGQIVGCAVLAGQSPAMALPQFV
ncbi:MAG: hypothetical protein LBD72_01850 [Puniceicoccales bacterium]|jgi:hypothetical protein|nr:hypothetical protein [Puniceicoccales bacterium]